MFQLNPPRCVKSICQNKTNKIPFLSTKRGPTGAGSSRTQNIFCQKIFQFNPPRCVRAVDPKGMEGP